MVEIPYKPGIEIATVIAIWIAGHAVWSLRFTRQWYEEILKEEKYAQMLVTSAIEHEPMRDFLSKMKTGQPDIDVSKRDVEDQFAVKIDARLTETEQKWDTRRQVLYGLIFLLLVVSLGLSPYLFALNICVVLFASRFIGGFHRVFSDALIAHAQTVDLIVDWFRRDPTECLKWCTESHTEFQTVIALIGSSKTAPI
jgi:hypothetical protein